MAAAQEATWHMKHIMNTLLKAASWDDINFRF